MERAQKGLQVAVLFLFLAGARAKHLLLLGETGAGKSTLGCLLLDSKVFQVGGGLTSCTSSIQKEAGRLFGSGQEISVSDTGGLGDTQGRDSDFVDAVAKHVRGQGGVHGIVYVHNACLTRLQKSAQESLLTMVHTLANESSQPSLWRRVGLALTQCSHRRPVYDRELPGELKKFLNVSEAPRMFWPTDPEASSGIMVSVDSWFGGDWKVEFAAWVAHLPSEPFAIPDESTRERLMREFEENRRREEEEIEKNKQETMKAKQLVEEAEDKVKKLEQDNIATKQQLVDAHKELDQRKHSHEEQKRKEEEHQPKYTPPQKKKGCFPPTATASLAVGGEREVGALLPGDTLSLPLWPGQSSRSTTVYLQDSHAGVPGQAVRPTTYLQIQHKLQPPHRPLLVTANHFVFTVQAGGAARGHDRGVVPAGLLQVGVDALLVVNKSTQTVEASEVQSIVEVELAGYAAPLTAAGELVVEGVLVSSYALPLHLWQAAPAIFRRQAQSIFHALTFPLRFRHHLWGMLSDQNPPALALQSILSFAVALLDIA